VKHIGNRLVVNDIRYGCPTGNNGVDVCGTYKDKKGGLWKLVCTNKNATGNFEWRYTKQGNTKAEKLLAWCRYAPGDNSEWADWKNGNIVTWRHETEKANTHDKKVETVFDKEGNKGKRIPMEKVNGCWKEKANCREIFGDQLAGTFSVLDTSVCIPPETEQAVWATAIQLYAVVDTTNANYRDILWSRGQLTPTYGTGDFINLAGMTTSDLVSLDPHYAASNTIYGLQLRVNTTVAPVNGDYIATVKRSKSTSLVEYAVVDSGAADFWANVMATSTSLDQLGYPCDEIQAPGYGSGFGQLDLYSPVGTPAVGEAASVALAILMASAALTALTRRRSLQSA
jgi:hypothetical protein